MNLCKKYETRRVGTRMNDGAKRLIDAYNVKKNAKMYVAEFGDGYFFGLDRWKKEGMTEESYAKQFYYSERGKFTLSGMTGDNILYPPYESEIISEDDVYFTHKDGMGREVKEFKNPTFIYMPEFTGYAVKDARVWKEDVYTRLDPESPARFSGVRDCVEKAKAAQKEGKLISFEIDGGFMYLRDLLGPQNLLYIFIDEPELIHEMMSAWLNVHTRLIEEYQKYISIDELFLKEDICYKTSSLISPDMIEEFLMPYYRQLIEGIKSRNLDTGKRLYLAMDSDGHIDAVIPLYKKIGVTIFSPFEVAADCDVVELGKKYPDITIAGGFDKRILASTKEAIKAELERIMPPMKARGGYFITCDHGVPENVPFENYLYFRTKIKEMSE